MGENLFEGRESLRVRGERASLWACIVAAPVVIAAISLIFPSVSLSEFVLLIVGGMVFVSIARGRLLGSSIRIEGRQLPEIGELAESVARRLGVKTPQVFVRDDPFVAISAAGIGDPYAVIVSSQYYEHLRRGELAFLIARELGHIAAGHTRITSLLSVSGRENPVVALVFGAWLRKTEYTADRIGLLCCDGLNDALGAISITTFHAIGRRVDMHVLAEQQRELETEPALRVGEWIAAVPYATNRLEALRSFAQSPLAATWRTRMASGSVVPVESITDPDHVTRRETAPLFRRLGAMLIDLAIIGSILKTPLGAKVTKVAAISATDLQDVPAILRPLISHAHYSYGFDPGVLLTFMMLFAYSAVLVGLSGQTLGMMVMELRVVTTKYQRPTLIQSFWRYAVALCSMMTTFAVLGFFMRVHPHDRLSRTRLVRGRKAA